MDPNISVLTKNFGGTNQEKINMRMIGILLTLSLSILAAQAVAEEAGCGANCGSPNKCAHCGQNCACVQCTCQLICGKEKVKKYCWEVKCEEFCPLLPGRACEECNSCNENESCPNAGKCGEKCPNPVIHTPHCGNARVKKTLVKKEYECERPKYKCVVQYLCPECSACNSNAAPATTAPAPAEGAKPATPAPAPELPPAPQPKTTYVAPLPPVIGTAYLTK